MLQLVTAKLTDDKKVADVTAAIKAADPNAQISYYIEAAIPSQTTTTSTPNIDHKLVQQVLDSVKPTPFLVKILTGANSWQLAEGDSKFSVRPDSIALSRRLKKVFPQMQSPIDALATRRRTYFAEGGFKGIEYEPTPLGRAVYRALKEVN
jgi:hypothetical protein